MIIYVPVSCVGLYFLFFYEIMIDVLRHFQWVLLRKRQSVYSSYLAIHSLDIFVWLSLCHGQKGKNKFCCLWECCLWKLSTSFTLVQINKNTKSELNLWIFPGPSVLTSVLGAQKNRLREMVLLSTHNICFGWKMKKLYLINSFLSKGLCSLLKHQYIIYQWYLLITFENSRVHTRQGNVREI